jgi:heat shock protein HslJ
MKTLITLGFIVLAIVFTSCDETKKVAQVAGSVQLSGSYKVTEANDTALSEDKKMSFVITALDKKIRGTTACNSFNGKFTVDVLTLRFSEMSISENYCDDKTQKAEENLMRALRTTGSYILKNNILTLYSYPDHSVILKAMKDTLQ